MKYFNKVMYLEENWYITQSILIYHSNLKTENFFFKDISVILGWLNLVHKVHNNWYWYPKMISQFVLLKIIIMQTYVICDGFKISLL